MMSLTVVLPTVPPSANNMYVNNPRTNGRFIKKAAKDWKEQTSDRIKKRAETLKWSLPPKTPIKVMIDIVHPRMLVFDVAGKEKAIMDALSDAIGIDDRYVLDLRLTKRRGDESVLITVFEWSEGTG